MRVFGRMIALLDARSCPRCQGSHLYLSRRRSYLEKTFGVLSIRPIRCHECNHRFWKFVRPRKRARALTSTRLLNPAIPIFGAAMVGFALLISAFPTLAICGFAGSAVGIISELYSGRWRHG